MKIKKLLIANRGEIALRIVRACKEMGIHSIVTYSVEDRNTLPVMLADEAVCIGKGSPQDSYLNSAQIISAATLLNVDAIHPGYGFLSENAAFARICEDYKIKFIGPRADVLEKIKDKAHVRSIAKKLGVPILPGNVTPLKSVAEARKTAKEIGYPIMLKAAQGGGGRGIRIISQEDELIEQFPLAQQEAKVSFGSDNLYIEKYLENPRHVEVQVLADEYGNVVHLGVRECSIQRRHQKILEEAPTMALSKEKIEKLEEDAVRLAKGINYTNAGTFEFLVDKDNYYFMEVNARIQVEHPVTEQTTGIDLIKEQINVASGKKLSYKQKDIVQKGWAMEFRINAEDPENNFRPSAGRAELVIFPGGRGVRVDSHIYSGQEISHIYDSLLGKLIVFGNSREECIKIGKRAMDEIFIKGVKTNISLHKKILNDKDFQKGNISTNFLKRFTE